MRSLVRVILLPALAVAFAACSSAASTSDGGSGGTTGGQDSGPPDSGSGACGSGCPTGQSCTNGQCRCPGDIAPCTSNPNIPGGECCGDNFACGSAGLGCVCNPPSTYCTLGDASVVCINTSQDQNNCGACGRVCDGGVACINSQCNYPLPDSGPLPDGGPDGGPDAGPPVPDAGLPGLGTFCTVPTASNPNDTCYTSYSLECVPISLPDGGTVATCDFPREIALCKPAVGCAVTTPPLHCSSGFQNASGMVDVCVNYCTTTNDCPDPGTTCIPGPTAQKLCFTDYCGPGVTGNGSLYGACNNASTGDGTCFSAGGGTFGICNIGGTIPDNQPCGTGLRNYFDGGTDQLCSQFSTCVFFLGTGASLCTPACSPGTSTQPCAAGSTCFSYGTGGPDYGLCLVDCTDGGTDCPMPLQCQLFGTTATTSECLPVPDAG